ncbi:hypothetical protein J2Z32_004199 [Paenibacillus turicensis]|uniref:DUF2953 domain-containing protein n=1 Tax=Paenibacillus turicensis TaxID=160487 RepID=A0ABS4FYA2_9BACL|nr:DUF2953 domain-containing protein [Paenibacillus turicensis]MBP1907524.1 hypothetical protein [Paenibacillus turicensis]
MWIAILGSIVSLLVIICVLIFFSNITCDITMKKHNHDEDIVAHLSFLYGIVSFKYEVPSIRFQKWKEGLKLEKIKSNHFFNASQENEAETKIDKEKVEGWINQLQNMLLATFGLKKWMNQALSKITVKDLEWSTHLALSDAAHTATLTGLVWGIKSSLIGFLSYHLILRKSPELDVVPVFGNVPVFFTKFHCIAKIRFGYAIYAVLVLMFRVLKVKGGMKKWLNILFKG